MVVILIGLVTTLILTLRTKQIQLLGTAPGTAAGSLICRGRTLRRKTQSPIRDLTTEFLNRPRSPSVDILALMHRRGLVPRLVSRAVNNNGSRDGQFKVHNIVHYIYFGKANPIGFREYLNFLGVHKFIRPDYIFVHSNEQYTGSWWDRTLVDVANIYYVRQQQPTAVFGRKIGWIQHASDFLRLQLLYDYGGIYLDNDVLVVASFDRLRNYDFTLDHEERQALANGVIVSRRGAPFLRVCLESYRDYRPDVWVGNSVHMAYKIASVLPHLIHVENGTMVHPTYENVDMLYEAHYNWRGNYCIRLYMWRMHWFPNGPQQLKDMRGTVGEVMRYTYAAES